MDAVQVRFRYSAVWETVSSFWALRHPQRHAVHQPWIRRARPLLRRPELAEHLSLLMPLLLVRAWLPDFLTPEMPGPPGDLEQELAVVAATPPARVRDELMEIDRVWHYPKGVLALADDPVTMLPRLVDALRAWHHAAIAPYWPRIRALLEADIAHRARCLADTGLCGLFDSLHPSMRWVDDRIVTADGWDLDLTVRGRGLTLMPGIFVDRKVLWNVSDEVPPSAVYPVRAVATLWESPGALRGEALARLLGPARANLLELAQTAATTTALAVRTGLSAGTVSQHLGVLYDAGLVGRDRQGRQVFYQTTDMGRALLGGGQALGDADTEALAEGLGDGGAFSGSGWPGTTGPGSWTEAGARPGVPSRVSVPKPTRAAVSVPSVS